MKYGIKIFLLTGLSVLAGIIQGTTAKDKTEGINNTDIEMNTEAKKLVVYFSHTGENYNVGYWKNRSRLGQCAGGCWDTFDAAKLMIFS